MTPQTQSMPIQRRRAPRRVVLTSWVALCTAIGLATAVLGRPDGWYANLDKPFWAPADWAFPLVWLALYVAMGMAAARVTRSRHPDASIALSYFVVQLALNAVSLPALFRAHSTMVSLVAAATLWLAAAATLALFRQIERGAALLYAPVLVWATFVLALAAEIVRLN